MQNYSNPDPNSCLNLDFLDIEFSNTNKTTPNNDFSTNGNQIRKSSINYPQESLHPYNDKQFLCTTFNFNLDYINIFLSLKHEQKLKMYLLIGEYKLYNKINDIQAYKAILKDISDKLAESKKKAENMKKKTTEQLLEKKINSICEEYQDQKLRKISDSLVQSSLMNEKIQSNGIIQSFRQKNDKQFILNQDDQFGDYQSTQNPVKQQIIYHQHEQNIQIEGLKVLNDINPYLSSQKQQINQLNLIKQVKKNILIQQVEKPISEQEVEEEDDWQWNSENHGDKLQQTSIDTSKLMNKVKQNDIKVDIWDLNLAEEVVKSVEPSLHQVLFSQEENKQLKTDIQIIKSPQSNISKTTKNMESEIKEISSSSMSKDLLDMDLQNSHIQNEISRQIQEKKKKQPEYVMNEIQISSVQKSQLINSVIKIPINNEKQNNQDEEQEWDYAETNPIQEQNIHQKSTQLEKQRQEISSHIEISTKVISNNDNIIDINFQYQNYHQKSKNADLIDENEDSDEFNDFQADNEQAISHTINNEDQQKQLIIQQQYTTQIQTSQRQQLFDMQQQVQRNELLITSQTPQFFCEKEQIKSCIKQHQQQGQKRLFMDGQMIQFSQQKQNEDEWNDEWVEAQQQNIQHNTQQQRIKQSQQYFKEYKIEQIQQINVQQKQYEITNKIKLSIQNKKKLKKLLIQPDKQFEQKINKIMNTYYYCSLQFYKQILCYMQKLQIINSLDYNKILFYQKQIQQIYNLNQIYTLPVDENQQIHVKNNITKIKNIYANISQHSNQIKSIVNKYLYDKDTKNQGLFYKVSQLLLQSGLPSDLIDKNIHHIENLIMVYIINHTHNIAKLQSQYQIIITYMEQQYQQYQLKISSISYIQNQVIIKSSELYQSYLKGLSYIGVISLRIIKLLKVINVKTRINLLKMLKYAKELQKLHTHQKITQDHIISPLIVQSVITSVLNKTSVYDVYTKLSTLLSDYSLCLLCYNEIFYGTGVKSQQNNQFYHYHCKNLLNHLQDNNLAALQ